MKNFIRIKLGILLFFGTSFNVMTDVSMASLTPVAVGEIATFSIESASGSGTLMYSWDFGDSSPETEYSEDIEATHIYKSARHYSVTVKMRDELGYISTSTRAQVIHPILLPVAPSYTSSIILNAKNSFAYNVNSDNNTVTITNPYSLEKVSEIPVGENPHALCLDENGYVWVTNRYGHSLSKLNTKTNKVELVVPLPFGSQPMGIVYSKTTKLLYVTLYASRKVVAVNPVSNVIVNAVEAGPYPRAIGIVKQVGEEEQVIVSRFISSDLGGEVSFFKSRNLAFIKKIILPVDTISPDNEVLGRGVPNYLLNFGITPDGSRVWVPSKKDNTLRGVARDGNPLNHENSVRSLATQILLNTGTVGNSIDINDRNLPSAVTFSPLGNLAFVAIEGSNIIEVYDAFDPQNKTLIFMETDLAPKGIVVTNDGKLLLVHNFLSRTVQVFDISGVTNATTNSAILLGSVETVENEILNPSVLLGKQIFYNSGSRKMNAEGYLSCASCHLDGGTDGRVWDFTDRGEGFRKTITMEGKGGMGHGPVHWSANFNEIHDFENDIRSAFSGLGFIDNDSFNAGTVSDPLGDDKANMSAELDALVDYVSSLTKLPESPYRNQDGSATESALRGEKIFRSEEVGCANCHTGSNFTDSRLPRPHEIPSEDELDANGYKKIDEQTYVTREGFILHDVGTINSLSGQRRSALLPGLDTPTLKGIWLDPPYLHDGSAPTLKDVLTTKNPEDKHGVTSKLSDEELKDLISYIQQLDGTLP